MDTAAEEHRDRAMHSIRARLLHPPRRTADRAPAARVGRPSRHSRHRRATGRAEHVGRPGLPFDGGAVRTPRAPLIVEIGSGRGEALVAAAAQTPDHDFLGLEVYVPGVAQTLVTMRHHGVMNVRLAVVNATEALATMLAPGSVRELWTWFPDPWHKKRHQSVAGHGAVHPARRAGARARRHVAVRH